MGFQYPEEEDTEDEDTEEEDPEMLMLVDAIEPLLASQFTYAHGPADVETSDVVIALDRFLFQFERTRMLVYSSFHSSSIWSRDICKWRRISVCAFAADLMLCHGRYEPRILAYGLAATFCPHSYRGGLCMKCRASPGGAPWRLDGRLLKSVTEP